MNLFQAAADLYTIPIYRKTTTQSASGAIIPSWTTTLSLSNIEIQPVSADVRQLLEGSRESVRYQCYASGEVNVLTGDRVKDPLASTTPTDPDLEVFQVEKWPAKGGLPAHTEFLLREIGD